MSGYPRRTWGEGDFREVLAQRGQDVLAQTLEDLELLQQGQVAEVLQLDADRLFELRREFVHVRQPPLPRQNRLLRALDDFEGDFELLHVAVEQEELALGLLVEHFAVGDVGVDAAHQEVEHVHSDDDHDDRQDPLERGAAVRPT